jgi:hypothetical protein
LVVEAQELEAEVPRLSAEASLAEPMAVSVPFQFQQGAPAVLVGALPEAVLLEEEQRVAGEQLVGKLLEAKAQEALVQAD